jgi:maltooligosyltrehalose trehalohydrolase
MSNIVCKQNTSSGYAPTTPLYSHGAFPQEDGTSRFSLWAPDADKVEVSLGDGRQYELQQSGNGWHSLVVECPAGTSYRYIINGKLRVPDPAARLQHGDAHGLSCLVNHVYPWQTEAWNGLPWHHAILYEVHVGLVGGFSKVEKLLPSLARLGITAIELMPINEFPGTRNWGYDSILPFAPESSYGTPDELKSLIDTAHRLGLMVILDVVYSHFGPDGNNLDKYASSFFRRDLHSPWGSAIDFRQREVRDFFCENALMWILDYRVDGLRLDAAHTIRESDFLMELARRVRGAIAPERHVHLILENENNNASLLQQGFNAQWNDDGHHVLHYLLTNESDGQYASFATSSTAKLARCLSEGFICQGEPNHSEPTPDSQPRGQPSAHLPPTAFVLFLQNHQQVGNRALGERLTQLADPDALKAAVVLVLLCPMVPLLFMGEEWGTKCPFLYFTDHEDKLAKTIRDRRRTEFAVDANSPSLRQQIPDPNAISTFLASRVELLAEVEDRETEGLNHEQSGHEQSERERWWDFYQQLLALRRREIIPHLPGTRSSRVTIIARRSLCAEWTLGNGTLLAIWLNLSANPVIASPPWEDHPVLFNHAIPESDYQQGILPPYRALATLRKERD